MQHKTDIGDGGKFNLSLKEIHKGAQLYVT